MSVAEILAAIHRLPEAERCELVAHIENEFFGFAGELTPEQIADVERRARAARQNPRAGNLRDIIQSELLERSPGQSPPPPTPSLEPYFAGVKALPFAERVELAHRLWDEFMEGFPDWKAAPVPEGVFAWKTLKTEIDAMLDSADRLELAQQVWRNIQENGLDSHLTPEQIDELDRRAEEARKSPEHSPQFAEILAEITNRPVSSQELKSGEGEVIGRRLQEHLAKPEPAISFAEAKARLAAKYGK